MNTPTFLEEIAQHLIEKYQMNFEHTVVVLPNKRAQLFLQEAIKTHAEKYVIAPKIISIEEFIAHLRSEEHTSELQSRENLVCRLLLEKKKKNSDRSTCRIHMCN